MQRLPLTILLFAAIIPCLPSCDVEPEPELGDVTFRDVDICVLINEPPTSNGDEAGDPPDLQLFPPCTDPAGCIEATSGYHYQTYFYAGGVYINLSGACPEWQSDPKVETSSEAAAEEMCEELYGHLCRSLCDCHGGTAVMEAGAADACVESTAPSTWACGCTCSLPT